MFPSRTPLLALGLCLTLGACQSAATQPDSPQATRSAAAQSTTQPAAGERNMDWEWVNYTPFPSVMSAVEKDDRFLLALSSKVTLTWEGNGPNPRLQLAKVQTPLQTETDGDGMSTQCTANGASLNDRTVDYPYTALLVRGGRLAQVRSPSTPMPLPLLTLTLYAQENRLIYNGESGRIDPEYAYAACIGSHRKPDSAQRIDHFLPADAILRIERGGKQPALTLQLDPEFAPFLFLRYHSGAMIPSPARIVLATVDVPQRTLTLHYRSLFVHQAPLRKLEYRAVLPERFGGGPSEDESEARYRERSQATLDDLAQCPLPPLGRYDGEACATPNRRPNRLIFLPSKQTAQ